ncbi:unnamed protein product [Pseudo-nitzschia multistriata]|uniref:RING-type domain-containing protein n=1 Tax=Pseudo-nitzschia multistriata TaxID=183589 RepID=A0A448ZQ24_9STRA|nr:unnamed protein product [Pseudo-nitzschia multistriata]
MWQHKWALWSGFLGASASCFVKMGTGGIDSSPLLRFVQTHLSNNVGVKSWLTDLDENLLRSIHFVLGELMIKHRINLMLYWKMIRTNLIEEFAIRLYLFEVDYCELCIMLPIRITCIVAMIITNAYMIASFLRGMKESGSVAGTSLSTASNFASSAMYGKLLWDESMNGKWCVGFTCVLGGVIILSSVTTTEFSNQINNEQGADVVVRREITKTRSPKRTIAKKTPPPPLTIFTKANIHPPAVENVITSSKVASVRSSFSPKIDSSSKEVGPTVTPSPRQASTPTFSKTVTSKPSSSGKTPRLKEKKILKPESALKQFYNFRDKSSPSSQNLISRSFVNECALCEGILFDETTGESRDAIADLSTNTCFHLFHAKCLKQASKSFGHGCPICKTPLAMWTSSKQAAQFPGFWLERVENYLLTIDTAPKNDMTGKDVCLPASKIRDHFKEKGDLTEAQKLYIEDDPSGLDKGLQAALEWGGYIDYNRVPKGRVGFSLALRTKGIWKYDPKKDDIWLWEWGSIHPRQRCHQCQLIKRPLPVECKECRGSSEAAIYCSESCAKRDKQRHQLTCNCWKEHGPKD